MNNPQPFSLTTQTPLRISFFGGGTDIPEFYEQHGFGCTLSTTITSESNYTYFVVVDESKYSNSGLSDLGKRICLDYDFSGSGKFVNIIPNIGVQSHIGSGLGGSSSFAIGLVRGLDTIFNKPEKSPKELAEYVYNIEREFGVCGKQDQYAIAHGGMNFIKYTKDDVDVEPIKLPKEIIQKMQERMLLIPVSNQRQSFSILNDVAKNISGSMKYMDELLSVAYEGYKIATSMNENNFDKNMQKFAFLLDDSWQLKKMTSKLISNSYIDDLYSTLCYLGCLGGKLLGAGGGGYLLTIWPDYPKLNWNNDTENNLKLFEIFSKNNIVPKKVMF